MPNLMAGDASLSAVTLAVDLTELKKRPPSIVALLLDDPDLLHLGRRVEEALRVVERFTRVDTEMILYEFAVDDPTSWTSPWSAEIPMVKTEGPLYEYACHEGNSDVRYLLEIYRNPEIQAAAEQESK